MPAYLIANVIIKDTDKFKDYMKATPPIIKQFGGRFLVRGGDLEICEGTWNPKRLVLVEFESMQRQSSSIIHPSTEQSWSYAKVLHTPSGYLSMDCLPLKAKLLVALSIIAG